MKYFSILIAMLINFSCNNQKSESVNTINDTSTREVLKQTTVEDPQKVEQDASAIGKVETEDFELTLHRVIGFELAPKAYQPFKVKPGTKLAVLDISVRNKKDVPIDMGKILIMSSVKDSKGKKYLSQWVVAAYIIDHPEKNHDSEYNLLWSNNFPAKESHRSILIGFDPPKEEKAFELSIAERPDVANPGSKTIVFRLE